ncbi:MFS transporter [Actinoallomurus liliacearum]
MSSTKPSFSWGDRAALAVLTCCVFVVGTAEYVMVGLLPDLAADLRVPLPTAGSLVSWYALVVTVGGPVVTALTLRIPRRPLLLALLAVFVAANVLAALASGFGMLLAARVIVALTHSTSFAVTMVLAVGMVPEGRRGLAIAVVSAGWNLAAVLGAPLGTWIGQTQGWRATFWAIAAIGTLTLLAVAAVTSVPADETAGPSRSELGALRDLRVLTVIGIMVLSQAGVFAVYTYITPLLGRVSGFGPAAVSVLLAVLGGAGLLGNVLGGRLTDRSPWAGLCAALAALAAVLAVFALIDGTRPGAVAGVLVLGVLMGTLIPLLQERAFAAAPSAPTLITAVGASAVNLGIASGSWLGGRALAGGLSLAHLPWAGILPVLAGLGLTVHATVRGRRPGRDRRPVPASS